MTLTEMATAVRLGRYLDVEITLVHEGWMVMPGPGAGPAARPRALVRPPARRRTAAAFDEPRDFAHQCAMSG
ncbi:hypothetical protein DN051_10895 [Streptomyces cadmiisoli]|uniref:Uncharacterized protein n=1 Tax=Streptomyces cadmiisoli TaxID=2184053 RepID=A0A2Z4IWB9_9ACTN|nr:hypothetical protein DN051_10895 [Streptomyces cadmiisoli]